MTSIADSKSAHPAVMRLAAAKLPVTSEVIDRTTPPRVGYESVEEVDLGPRVITKGQLEAIRAAATLATEPETPVVAGSA